MRVYIAYDIVDAPTGGGNQFLRLLREDLRVRNLYSEEPTSADVILFNGHHNIPEIAKIKRLDSSKKIIHRLDGLQKLYNKPDDIRQEIAFKANHSFADYTIFQSRWALEKHIEFGLDHRAHKVITNCVDENIFNTNSIQKKRSGKIDIITTSWSPNKNKGFDCYRFLDKNLDFQKYSFVIVGNCPYEFKNIAIVGPYKSKSVAQLLKRADLYITASKNDCCSNSLLEALACGLPVVARNSGGNPEIVGSGGVLFETEDDILGALEYVSENLEILTEKVKTPSRENVVSSYIEAFREVYEKS